MSFVLILPIFSKELDYKAGFETKLYKNRLTLYELFSGIGRVFSIKVLLLQ